MADRDPRYEELRQALVGVRTQATEEAPPPELAPGEVLVGTILFEAWDEDDWYAPPPEILVSDVLYGHGVHWVSGPPGEGKTSFVMHMAILVMQQGKHVAWLDWEGGVRGTLRRLRDCGCDMTLAREFFHYAGWPQDAEKSLVNIAAQWPEALTVLDSASKALSFAGLNENDNTEVTTWTKHLIQAAKNHALPLVVIDHVAKQDKSKYARGASAKGADADVAWRVEKLEDFNRESGGLIRVVQHKDREGYFPFKTLWEIGDGQGNLTLTPTDREERDAEEEESAGDLPPSI